MACLPLLNIESWGVEAGQRAKQQDPVREQRAAEADTGPESLDHWEAMQTWPPQRSAQAGGSFGLCPPFL